MLDVQAAWLILLHCASANANYVFEQVQQFDQMHDQRLWQCFACVNSWELHLNCATTLPEVLPLFFLFLEDRMAGFWASWADCLPMINARHPEVLPESLLNWKEIQAGRVCRQQNRQTGVRGFEPPSPPVGGHWPVCSLPTTRNRRSRDGKHEASRFGRACTLPRAFTSSSFPLRQGRGLWKKSEGGARVTTLEIVADGLPLFGGAQLGLRRDGTTGHG